jgi:hypothetical protein
MLIPIITDRNQPGLVPPNVLDRMLACGEINSFERSSGWVMVGRDPIRSARRTHHGVERRSQSTSHL